MRRALVLALAFAMVWLAPQLPGQEALRGQSPFPHERHARLFPNCEGCHDGVVSGRADRIMPAPAQCETCHNGTDAKRVSWTPRVHSGQGLLRFSHPDHAVKVDTVGRRCESCHAEPNAPRMQVDAPRATRCFSCHTHRAAAHYDESNNCSTCHVPLTAATAISTEGVARLPRPATHETPAFVSTHGGHDRNMASCATCHARESCVRCHMNASSIPVINALGADARVAANMRGKPAVYPRPSTHLAEDFVFLHGGDASREPARCASCHARPSCRACHTGAGASRVIDALPNEPTGAGAGRGVQLQRASLSTATPHGASTVAKPRAAGSAPLLVADTGTRKVWVHAPGFERDHAEPARAGLMTCDGCHTQSMCASCHSGERSRLYHKPNFAMRHAATAYSRETDCASCHNTEAFCRDCHRTTGIGARGTGTVSYHTAQPQWLLQHGRAARQNLTTCTSCHQQRDCMQCHSTLGWSVNP
ncbi:MAG: cytochrome c3 family protein, partial [Gemmatimonadaceae bacterium]